MAARPAQGGSPFRSMAKGPIAEHRTAPVLQPPSRALRRVQEALPRRVANPEGSRGRLRAGRYQPPPPRDLVDSITRPRALRGSCARGARPENLQSPRVINAI